ncbi:13157_t:CDS:2, partial [Acaulospora colombiana]
NVAKDVSKIKLIYEKSIGFMKTSILTDVMFLYQPSQVSLAAFRMAAKQDKFDFNKYEKVESLYKILDEIEEIIRNHGLTSFEQAKLIDARLLRCKNPEKNPNSAMKRNLAKEEIEDAERRKKKKLAEEYQKDVSSVFD